VLPWPREFNALLYVLAGRGAAGGTGAALSTGTMVVFGDGDELVVSADAHQDAASPDLEVLVLGAGPSANRWPPTGPSS